MKIGGTLQGKYIFFFYFNKENFDLFILFSPSEKGPVVFEICQTHITEDSYNGAFDQ